MQRIDFKVQSFPIKWPLLAVVEDDQEKTLETFHLCIASNYHCDEQLYFYSVVVEKVTRRDIETKESNGTDRDRLKKKKKVEEGQFSFHVFHRHLL